MARISRRKQVLCVTHLPQLAAMADTHFSVEKDSMTTESLTREFPLYTPSLLNLVKTSETHVKGLSPEG